MILFYGYDKCSTCRKAKAYLVSKGIAFREIDITKTAPSSTILQAMLRAGQYAVTDLLNRSGELYRQLNMKEKLRTMSEADIIQLLSSHGRLVKRPLITDGTRHTVGFDAVRFKQTWG